MATYGLPQLFEDVQRTSQ